MKTNPKTISTQDMRNKYEAPAAEVVEVTAEHGFAISSGIDPWGEDTL